MLHTDTVMIRMLSCYVSLTLLQSLLDAHNLILPLVYQSQLFILSLSVCVVFWQIALSQIFKWKFTYSMALCIPSQVALCWFPYFLQQRMLVLTRAQMWLYVLVSFNWNRTENEWHIKTKLLRMSHTVFGSCFTLRSKILRCRSIWDLKSNLNLKKKE